MLFPLILLQIFQQFNGERSKTAAYYLLHGKKSGQTIQDVHTLKLYKYFHLMPYLKKEIYDEHIRLLEQQQYIKITNDIVKLMPAGEKLIKENGLPDFYSWDTKGNEWEFSRRIQLIVQTLSHIGKEDRRFIAIIKQESTRFFVKQWIKRNYDANTASNLLEEIETILLMNIFTDIERQLFVLRLTGKEVTAYTWEQIASHLNMATLDAIILYSSLLQKIIRILKAEQRNFPMLFSIVENLLSNDVLTQSANETYNYWINGHEIDVISKLRNLKVSTIEDHIVEIAMVNEIFPFERYVDLNELEKLQQIIIANGTTKLSILKNAFSHLSYFQLRLLLAKRSHR